MSEEETERMHIRDLLIATLNGWESYKKEGVECSIEEYVNEVESNLTV